MSTSSAVNHKHIFSSFWARVVTNKHWHEFIARILMLVILFINLLRIAYGPEPARKNKCTCGAIYHGHHLWLLFSEKAMVKSLISLTLHLTLVCLLCLLLDQRCQVGILLILSRIQHRLYGLRAGKYSKMTDVKIILTLHLLSCNNNTITSILYQWRDVQSYISALLKVYRG